MGSVNWQQLQEAAGEASFEALPPSVYDVVVDAAEATQSSSGKDMIKTTFRVEGGPYHGRKVFNQFVLSPENPNALNFFFRHMRAMGLGSEFFAANPRTEQVASALVGQPCRVRLSQREWPQGSGEFRNNVDAVMAAVAVGMTPGTPPATSPAPVGPPGLNGQAPPPPPAAVAPPVAPSYAPSYAPPAAAVPPPPSVDDEVPF